jgi:hypothetical protein
MPGARDQRWGRLSSACVGGGQLPSSVRGSAIAVPWGGIAPLEVRSLSIAREVKDQHDDQNDDQDWNQSQRHSMVLFHFGRGFVPRTKGTSPSREMELERGGLRVLEVGDTEPPAFAGITIGRLEVSTSAVDHRERDDRVQREYVRRVGIDETKVAFKTTEFLAYLATVAGVLIAAAVDETIDARLAWILVAAVGIGYMLSRGLAKSGSNHREGSDTI